MELYVHNDNNGIIAKNKVKRNISSLRYLDSYR